MSVILKALNEASLSVACVLDDIAVDENNDIKLWELQKDIEHIQDQITILENFINISTIKSLNIGGNHEG